MTKASKYDRRFYLDQRDDSRRSASEVIPVLLSQFRPKSVIDVGCGVGTWLSIFREHGIEDVLGLDGAHVDRSLLEIPDEQFREVDLNGDFSASLERRFDCAMSLEVAEHLEPSSSETFVQCLTSLSDVVLFSAGIPAQGGTGHINENWLEYWVILFRKAGYIHVDSIRPAIWDNDRVDWWYRQNVIFFVSEAAAPRVFPEWDPQRSPSLPLSIVHPELFLWTEHRRRWFGKGAHFGRDVAKYRELVERYRRTGPEK